MVRALARHVRNQFADTPKLCGHPLERAPAAEQQVNGFLTEVFVVVRAFFRHVCSLF